MAVILSPYKVPELAGLSKPQARQVWQKSYWFALRTHWQVWASIVGAALLALLGDHTGRAVAAPYVHNTDLAGYLGVVIGGAVGGLLCQVAVTHYVRKHISKFLN